MVISPKQMDDLIQALRTQINGTFGGCFDSGVYTELDTPLKDSSLLLKEVNERGEALLSKLWTNDKELTKAHKQLIELFHSFCDRKSYLNYVTQTKEKIDKWWQEHPGQYFNTNQAQAIAKESFYAAFAPAISEVLALEDLADKLFEQVQTVLTRARVEKGVYAEFCQPLLQAHLFYLVQGGDGLVLDFSTPKKVSLLSNRTVHLPPTVEHAQKYTEVAGWKLDDYSKLVNGNKQRNKFYSIPIFETEQAQNMAETAFYEAFKETRKSYHHINLDLSILKAVVDED